MSTSTSTSRQQHQLQQQKQNLENALEEQKSPEVEAYQEGQEFDSERAARLQPHYGNQTVQDLLNKLNDVDNALADLELQSTQDIQEDVEEEQELELEDELEFSGFGGGGGVGTGATSGNPWEFEVFFGGDDDDSPAALRRRQRRVKAQINEMQMPEPEAPKPPPNAAAQMAQLLPTPRQGHRTGDSIYIAPELALLNPDKLYNQSLDPNDLATRKGKADPIRSPVEIGRFLEKQPTTLLAQSIAEIVSGPAAALVIPQGGFSTACARLATLAVCSEAALSPQHTPQLVDQAVQLALRDEIWSQAVQIAEQLAPQGLLHAPAIFKALRNEVQTDAGRLPTPSQLGGAALQQILPLAPYVSIPHLRIAQETEVEFDETLALIDAAIAEFANGEDPEAVQATPTLDSSTIQPALQTCNELLSALGRAQVEFAAAAAAIHLIKPAAPLMATLGYANTALQNLARAVIRSGKRIERMRNKPLTSHQKTAEKAVNTINETRKAYLTLRTWAFSTIAGGLNVA
ncbi:MAG: hypothetical protein VXZ96_18285 [Myxococcota bacterium]|nr:hypothetical protein [Myxococcota bacterium]